ASTSTDTLSRLTTRWRGTSNATVRRSIRTRRSKIGMMTVSPGPLGLLKRRPRRKITSRSYSRTTLTAARMITRTKMIASTVARMSSSPAILDTPGPSRCAPRIKGLAGHATREPQNGKRRPRGSTLHAALGGPGFIPLSRGTNPGTAVSDEGTISGGRHKMARGSGNGVNRASSHACEHGGHVLRAADEVGKSNVLVRRVEVRTVVGDAWA